MHAECFNGKSWRAPWVSTPSQLVLCTPRVAEMHFLEPNVLLRKLMCHPCPGICPDRALRITLHRWKIWSWQQFCLL